MLTYKTGLGLLDLLGVPTDGELPSGKSHTRTMVPCYIHHTQHDNTGEWFAVRLQELAETEQRNRATFNRAVSAVTSTSKCSSISRLASASAPAVPQGGERGLQRLATGVMTGMGTVAGGVAVAVGGVATGVTTVTDGMAKLLQPGDGKTADDA